MAYRRYRESQGQYWTLELFYSLKGSGAKRNIFHSQCLKEMRQIEDAVRNFKGFQDVCYRGKDNDGCRQHVSPLNLFYANVLPGEQRFVFNGTASTKLRREKVERIMANSYNGTLLWFADKHAKTVPGSNASRAVMFGGMPLPNYASERDRTSEQLAKHRAWLESLYHEVLVPMRESPSIKCIDLTWNEESTLVNAEVMDILKHDSLFSLGSFAFVAMFIFLHFFSFTLTISAVFSILLSFPTAYFWFQIITGETEMMILNFVALFLIMGIGADDVFVMFAKCSCPVRLFSLHSELQLVMKFHH